MKKVLLVGGSLNQTMMVHEVGKHLKEFECFYSPLYADGILTYPRKWGWLNRSALGFGRFYQETMEYFAKHELLLDPEGKKFTYDLVVLPTDLVVPNNIRGKRIVLVQEGMTDPANWFYYLTRALRLPHWVAVNTYATGLSDAYDKFCVASEGYRDLFISKGIKPEKIEVTGIPNYDNAAAYCENSFPHHGHVLVATSDMREALKYEDRKAFLRHCVKIAKGRQLIFKLHPNEIWERAKAEIEEVAPGSLVFQKGNVHQMIANASEVITRFSTVVYTGLALNKTVHSEFNLQELKKLQPIQNGGTSGKNIANVCRRFL